MYRLAMYSSELLQVMVYLIDNSTIEWVTLMTDGRATTKRDPGRIA